MNEPTKEDAEKFLKNHTDLMIGTFDKIFEEAQTWHMSWCRSDSKELCTAAWLMQYVELFYNEFTKAIDKKATEEYIAEKRAN